MSFLRRKLQPVVHSPHDSPSPRLREIPGQASATRSAEHVVVDRSEQRPTAASLSGLRVLVCCTANISRSPLGQVLLQRELGLDTIVSSAGIRAAAHLDTDPRSATFAAARGLDLSGHRPRQLTGEVLATDGADLVLVMTREHVREVSAVDLVATKRTFTFKEFARRAERADLRPGPLGSFVAQLSADRSARDLLGEDPRDDVADPYGRSESFFQNVAAEIETLCVQIAEAINAVAGNGR